MLFFNVLTVFLLYLANQTYICRLILLSTQITMSTKTKGTVKFFNGEKGFGFIKHDDSNKETFVHASGLIDQVTEGDKVEFDLQEGKKGMNAVNVKKA
jgi:CspA family cold shock protein